MEHRNEHDRHAAGVRSGVGVMLATLLSRLLGFLRIAVIGALFGGGGVADVIHIVFGIPNNLRKLMAEGALSAAFIPVLSRANLEDPDGRRGRALGRSLLGLQYAILVPVALAGTIFARPVVSFLLDFTDPERLELAAQLFRPMIWYALLVSLSAVLMGILQSHERFLVPAFSPILFSVSVISSMLLLHRSLGPMSVAVGVLVGGLLQTLAQLPATRTHGYSLLPRFRWRDADSMLVLRHWAPVVATSAVFALNQQVAFFFASGLPKGSGAAIGNAIVFWQLPFGLFSATIATVLFPQLIRLATTKDLPGVAATMRFGVASLFAVLLPSAVVLGVFSHQMIAVALERGAFDAEATDLTARVLVGYLIGLFSVGGYNFLQRSFYALSDYRSPITGSVIVLVTDIALSLWLKETALGVVGLALANSIAFSIGYAYLRLRLHVRLGAHIDRYRLKDIAKTVLLCAVLVPILMAYRAVTRPIVERGGIWMSAIVLTGGALLAAAVIVGLFVVLRVEVLDVVRRRKKATTSPGDR